MNHELDTAEVGDRLHSEFALLTEPPPPTALGVVAAGRRRHRRMVGGLAAVFVAVIAVLPGEKPTAPTSSTSQGPTWTWNGRSHEGMPRWDWSTGVLPPPGDRREWTGWLTDTKLGDAIRAAIRVAAPGLRIDDMSISRDGRFLESGGNALVKVSGADGRKALIGAGVYGKVGGAPELASRLATTGVRDYYAAGPQRDAPGVRRERRTLPAGLEAVVYPQGAESLLLPVDLFTPHRTAVHVATGMLAPANATNSERGSILAPARSLVSPEQLLTIARRLGSLRGDGAVPPGRGKVVMQCEDRPPPGFPVVTAERVNAAAWAALQQVVHDAKVTASHNDPSVKSGGLCWESASTRMLNGKPAGSGHYFGGAKFAGSRSGSLVVVIALQPGEPASRAARLARSGDRRAAGFNSAPIEVGSEFPKEVRTLPDGMSAVIYPKGAGPTSFRSLPVDVFAPGGLNLSISVRKKDDYAAGNMPPADAVLTIEELLQIGQAIATSLR